MSEKSKKAFTWMDWADLYYWLALAAFVVLASITTVAYFAFDAFSFFNQDGQVSRSFIIWALLGIPVTSLGFPVLSFGAVVAFLYSRSRLRRLKKFMAEKGI